MGKENISIKLTTELSYKLYKPHTNKMTVIEHRSQVIEDSLFVKCKNIVLVILLLISSYYFISNKYLISYYLYKLYYYYYYIIFIIHLHRTK